MMKEVCNPYCFGTTNPASSPRTHYHNPTPRNIQRHGGMLTRRIPPRFFTITEKHHVKRFLLHTRVSNALQSSEQVQSSYAHGHEVSKLIGIARERNFKHTQSRKEMSRVHHILAVWSNPRAPAQREKDYSLAMALNMRQRER